MTIPEHLQKYQLKPELFQKAMTHRSYLNENAQAISNERLEFLGDAILEFLVSQQLFNSFSDQPEGILTSMRSRLVRTNSLAQIAQRINLPDHLMMAKGELSGGGNFNPSLLENALEALIGAIYLSSGLNSVSLFLEDHLYPQINQLSITDLKDPKSAFQEHIQSQGLPTPVYQIADSQGPDHNKTFTAQVKVNDTVWGTGSGKSKQSAEQSAAEQALNSLDDNV